MRWERWGAPGREIPVVLDGATRRDLRPITPDIDGAFLASGGPARVAPAIADGRLPEIDVTGLRRGAPITGIGKIVGIGLNFRDHAAETGAAIPAEPVVFLKDATTVQGPDDAVQIPRGSRATDWEVELGVVIGREARYLESAAQAREAIAGYVLSHDVSERDFQLDRGGTWDKGKSCATFNPLGPVLVTPDEIPDPQALGMRTWVNGVLRQDGSTADMIFPVVEIVRYLSHFLVLRPGDVINTGTPAGVALGRDDVPYLRAGDVVELEIDGLGRARQEMENA